MLASFWILSFHPQDVFNSVPFSGSNSGLTSSPLKNINDDDIAGPSSNVNGSTSSEQDLFSRNEKDSDSDISYDCNTHDSEDEDTEVEGTYAIFWQHPLLKKSKIMKLLRAKHLVTLKISKQLVWLLSLWAQFWRQMVILKNLNTDIG